MRARLPADWDRDLAGRHGIEHDVARSIAGHAGFRLVANNTASMTEPDYTVVDDRGRTLAVELKTRRQTPGPSWRTARPDTDPQDLFVLDELTVRKLVPHAPHAYLLVADLAGPCTRWIVFSIGDLIVIDRTRISRPLNTGRTGRPSEKGKWLIDLSDAPAIEDTLDGLLDQMSLLTRTVDVCWPHIGLWPTTPSRTNPNRTPPPGVAA